MLFWALLASGQITMRRVDGWQTLDRSPTDLDFAACCRPHVSEPRRQFHQLRDTTGYFSPRGNRAPGIEALNEL